MERHPESWSGAGAVGGRWGRQKSAAGRTWTTHKVLNMGAAGLVNKMSSMSFNWRV